MGGMRKHPSHGSHLLPEKIINPFLSSVK